MPQGTPDKGVTKMTRDQMRNTPSGGLINAMAEEINTGEPATWVTEAVNLVKIDALLRTPDLELLDREFNLDSIRTVRDWSF
jgi:hypothetical protein